MTTPDTAGIERDPDDDNWPTASDGRLVPNDLVDGICDVSLRMTEAIERTVANQFLKGTKPKPQTLIRLNFGSGRMQIFPQLTLPTARLYGPKYPKLREIDLPFDTSHPPPADHYGVIDILSELPRGLIRDPSFGLGFRLQMRPFVKAAEKLSGLRRLVFDGDGDTTFDGHTLWFNEDEYETFALAMGRIANKHQAVSLRDREILAHNAALHRVQPQTFEYKEAPYEPGTIFKLLGGQNSSKVKLRGKDRKGVLAALAANANDILARDEKEFMQLQKDIEVASLDQLITSVRSRLKRNASELEWQRLLELNPFILSMLFGQPIVILQASASVGGQTIAGSGTKIADFLGKNPLTHNAAIVELKRPDTKLCGAEYRSGVFGPSPALSGAIIQVLDQRLKLKTDIAGIKHRSNLPDLQVHSVECVVVAGRTSDSREERSSFELFRSQLKDVRVATFDELLERLHILRELLAGERYVSQIDENEDEDEFSSLLARTPDVPY